MANRPSTAEILAAARASDGKRNGGATALADPPLADTVEPKQSKSTDTPEVGRDTKAAEASGVTEGSPPSVASMLTAVRQERSPEKSPANAPPNVSSILKQVKEDRPGNIAAPPSMGRILSEIRGTKSAAGSTVTPDLAMSSETKTPAAKSAGTSPKRGGTADILAAARQQGAAGKSQKPAENAEKKPSVARPSGTSAILAAARKQGAASKPAGKPEKSSAARPSGTSAILAAARKQGAATGKASPGGTNAKENPASTPKNKEPMRPEAAKDTADRADGRPRPPRIAEILARVRCDSGENTTPLELPSLGEMLVALRQQPAERSRRQSARPEIVQPEAVHWTARLRNWFTARGDRRIAVRQFDHS